MLRTQAGVAGVGDCDPRIAGDTQDSHTHLPRMISKYDGEGHRFAPGSSKQWTRMKFESKISLVTRISR
ncbi:uncharacterized protein RSE6_13931 [Rhynchosporium secalis]|uniref:Uncharacterized protein n=1 Tax=Rhynchosporium secalis TaxID=38038 RepID=A0A1E1MU21_RHYSE|nr:uncharacterized protein RSE6_13931 [Rhynchosporium secalis]